METGISRGTVSKYERAATDEGMKRPYLVAWAVRTDVPLEWLLTGRGDPGKPPGGGDELHRLTQAKKARASATRRRSDSTNHAYMTAA